MKKFVSALVFFMVGFVAGGSSAAQAADPHDIIGGLIGLGILHEVLENNRDEREYRRERRYETYGPYSGYDRRNRRWSRNGDGRYYEGDMHDAYRKHFPCGQQYAGYRNCQRVIEGDRTIIIIER